MRTPIALLALAACGGPDTDPTDTADGVDPALVFASCTYESVQRNAGGAITASVVGTYDESGLLAEQIVYDAGGALLSSTTFTWRSDGQPLGSETRDAEGAISARAEYGYDGDRLVTVDYFDATGPTGRTERIWGEGEHPEREEYDYGPDGTVDSIGHLAWEGAHLVQNDTDGDADGDVDLRITWVWSDGVIVRMTIDGGADGTVETVTENTYDAEGRLVRSETSTDGDLAYTTDLTWDCP